MRKTFQQIMQKMMSGMLTPQDLPRVEGVDHEQ